MNSTNSMMQNFINDTVELGSLYRGRLVVRLACGHEFFPEWQSTCLGKWVNETFSGTPCPYPGCHTVTKKPIAAVILEDAAAVEKLLKECANQDAVCGHQFYLECLSTWLVKGVNETCNNRIPCPECRMATKQR